MKRYIQVEPHRSLTGGIISLAVVALVIYGLVEHPVEAAQIAQAAGAALARIAQAIVEILQSA